MPAATSNAPWREAVIQTVALWCFVLLTFLPLIVERYGVGDWGSILLDSSTILLSIGIALAIFGLFRTTLTWPNALRGLVLGGSVVFAALFNTTFDILFTGWVAENLNSAWQSLPRNLERGYGSAFRYLCIFSINLALFQLSFSRRWIVTNERQLSEAKTSAQQAQLAALRYQLNPHFLFNTLNSISALIVTRRNEDAELMTEKLSSFLRTSLAFDPTELVPLEEELSLTEEYLDIESVRFRDKLIVEIDCDPEAGAMMVPGFLVQPLVENAVKHGVAPSREPVRISIKATVSEGDLCIEVANDRAPIIDEIGPARSGVGLVNVRRRLEAVYGDNASLTTELAATAFTATICIPGLRRGQAA